MDEVAHSSAAADPDSDAEAPPAASSGAADTAEEALCPQATHQPEAETCAVRETGGTGRTDAAETRDNMHNRPFGGCAARGTGRGSRWRRPPTATRGRGRTSTSRCGHEPDASEITRQSTARRPRDGGHQSSKRRRQSSMKSHQRQISDCKRTSTCTTMCPSPPSWHLARTGPPPGGGQPHPRCGTRCKRGSRLALRGILPPRPTRHIFAATMPPWDQWQLPFNQRGGRSCSRTLSGGYQSTPTRTGYTDP